MSTPAVAAGAAALGFYVWLKQWQCGYASLEELPILPETHARTEAPPTTWTETFYLFKEALRYTYQETFARWHAVDLFFGLAYISRRATSNYPAADIAAAGIPLSNQQLTAPEAQGLLSELQQVRRFMLYCQGLRHHRLEQQKKHWMEHVHLRESDILKHNPVAGLLRPAYVVIKDRTMGSIILCIRGTHSRSDMFTSLTGTVKPHHVVTSDGVVLGYSHLGMLAAARWLMASTKSTLISALQQNPDYNLKIVGHSMGAGTAALLTMMLRDKVPELATATAWAIACPACMTLQLARSCAPFVTTLVHGTDIVPTFSSGAIDKLRQEVMQSSWFADFQRDIRQQLTANFTSSMRGLRQGAAGTAQWTQRNIIRTAATSISSCYSRAPRSCYCRAPKQKPAATAGTAAQQPPAAATTVATGKASSSKIHAPSRIGRRLPGRAKASTGGAVRVCSVAGGCSSEDADAALLDSRAAGNASMGVAAAAASGSQQQTAGIVQPQQQRGAAGWLGRMMGFGGTHHKDAAATLPGASGSRLLSDSAATGAGGTDIDVDNTVVSEAMLVERALEACLAAVDNGQMSSHNSAGGQQTADTALANNSRAVSPAGAALPTSAGASSSSRAAAGNLLKGVSRAILGKRPAAPGKKDDDEASNMEIEPAEAADAGGSHLPVSTAAADPAEATSSGSKPLPLSLRRRGWGWDAVFGTPGRGWVTNDDSANHSSSDAAASGGQSVVQYIGQTVGHTGKAVLQTTGQLLRGGSMFQNCAAPTAAVDGQVPHLPPRPTSKQRRRRQRRKQQQQLDPGANGSVMVAPGSSSDLMRMHRDGVASLAQDSLAADAAAAGVETGSWHEHRLNSSSGGSSDGDQSLSADETLDGDSSSDPDLVDGRSGSNDTDDGLMTALNMPAMQASISALMAAVGDDPEQQDLYSQAHREETLAAERLLRESNRSRLTFANMGVSNEQITADPTQQQRQQQYQWQRQADAGTADSDSECLEQQPGAATEDEESSLADEQQQQQQQQHDYDDAAGAADHSARRAAERKARRQMFPAGRVLHLMPASVVAEVGEQQQQPAFVGMDATAVTDGVTADPAGVTPDASFQQPLQQQGTTNGHSAVGNEYVLLQVDNVEVYGRMRLCPTMVRDHFIPSYLRALDSVMGQLKRQLEPCDDG